MPPQVSVILPNYNHAVYLDKRLDSILKQTYQDFEIIILDDCSTDNSREVIERYRSNEKVSRIIFNETNSGSTFNQWDLGISYASGRFIWIAESDDYCESTFLQELVPPLEADNDLVIAYCQSLFVSPDERIVNKTQADKLARRVPGEEFLAKYMLGVNPIANVSMAILRKDIITSVSPEYKSFRYCGDWLFYTGMCRKGAVFISGKYLNYYLRHDNSVTGSVTKMGLDFLEGNRVFHVIKDTLKVNEADTVAAINKRIDKYIEVQDLLNEEVKAEVLKSMHNLDPLAPGLLNKRLRMVQTRKFLGTIKRMITS